MADTATNVDNADNENGFLPYAINLDSIINFLSLLISPNSNTGNSLVDEESSEEEISIEGNIEENGKDEEISIRDDIENNEDKREDNDKFVEIDLASEETVENDFSVKSEPETHTHFKSISHYLKTGLIKFSIVFNDTVPTNLIYATTIDAFIQAIMKKSNDKASEGMDTSDEIHTQNLLLEMGGLLFCYCIGMTIIVYGPKMAKFLTPSTTEPVVDIEEDDDELLEETPSDHSSNEPKLKTLQTIFIHSAILTSAAVPAMSIWLLLDSTQPENTYSNIGLSAATLCLAELVNLNFFTSSRQFNDIKPSQTDMVRNSDNLTAIADYLGEDKFDKLVKRLGQTTLLLYVSVMAAPTFTANFSYFEDVPNDILSIGSAAFIIAHDYYRRELVFLNSLGVVDGPNHPMDIKTKAGCYIMAAVRTSSMEPTVLKVSETLHFF